MDNIISLTQRPASTHVCNQAGLKHEKQKKSHVVMVETCGQAVCIWNTLDSGQDIFSCFQSCGAGFVSVSFVNTGFNYYIFLHVKSVKTCEKVLKLSNLYCINVHRKHLSCKIPIITHGRHGWNPVGLGKVDTGLFFIFCKAWMQFMDFRSYSVLKKGQFLTSVHLVLKMPLASMFLFNPK